MDENGCTDNRRSGVGIVAGNASRAVVVLVIVIVVVVVVAAVEKLAIHAVNAVLDLSVTVTSVLLLVAKILLERNGSIIIVE